MMAFCPYKFFLVASVSCFLVVYVFFQECLVLMNTCLFYLRQNEGLRPFVHIVVVQKALDPGEIAVTIFIYMEST